MELSRFSVLWTVIGLLVTLEFGYAGDIRCGGDGPTPFENSSELLNSWVRWVEPAWRVVDFLFWDSRNEIVFRNENRDLKSVRVGSGYDTQLTMLGIPLARIVDKEERYLVTQDGHWIFDNRFPQHWTSISETEDLLLPLFWNDQHLYLYGWKKLGPNRQRIAVYRYAADSQSVAQSHCEKTVFFQQSYRLGKGHEFPHLVLYQSDKDTEGHHLTISTLNVEECRFDDVKSYRDPLPGEIRTVMHLGSRAYAVSVDHPSRNLLWDWGDGCRYYNLAGEKPFILNRQFPLVGTWNASKGLTIFNLQNSEMMPLAVGSQFSDLGERQIVLSKRGDRLFAAPRYHGDGKRWLFEVLFKKPFSPLRDFKG